MPLWRDRAAAWHDVMPGVRRRILANAPSATMALYRIEPNREFPRHAHPHAQHGTFLEGGGKFEVGGVVWTLGPGDSYSIPPDVPHELKTDPNRVSVILDVFTPEREEFRSEVLAPDIP